MNAPPSSEPRATRRVRVYQLFVRLFGNPNAANVRAGSFAENGAGSFEAVDDRAVAHIQSLGMTHVWLTGVLRHATRSVFVDAGVAPDDPAAVKGAAGSPYAVADCYDVAPALARDPARRLEEFERLVARLHTAGLAVLIDFVPNHIARSYRGVVRPERDFGRGDDRGRFFTPRNEMFYLVDPPDQALRLPGDGGPVVYALEDGREGRVPRASANNQVAATLSGGDWYDAVKLNYGYNFADGTRDFSPRPPLWDKMNDVLAYWQSKGVDGFRCDFAHWVPVEFWAYAITAARARDPRAYFLAEAYDNDDGSPQAGTPPGSSPRELLGVGFDAVYDHLAFGCTRGFAAGTRTADDLDRVRPPEAFESRYLRYAENHDERRAASPSFPGAAPADTGCGSPEAAFAATAALVLSTGGPFLLYAGQEVGERGEAPVGFGGGDGRSTLFDYGSPHALRALHLAGYDPARLPPDHAALLARYVTLLALAGESAFGPSGDYIALAPLHRDEAAFGDRGRYLLAFARAVPGERRMMVCAVNIHPSLPFAFPLRVPAVALELLSLGDVEQLRATPRLGRDAPAREVITVDELRRDGLPVVVAPQDAVVFCLEPVQ